MAQESNETVVVETSYSPEVLTNFDEHGHLINPATRFSMQCNICHVVNLSFVNHAVDKKSAATHEPFVVLPRCGHAFGYECILGWVWPSINKENPKCPSCRKEIFRSKDDVQVFRIFGVCNAEEQPMEIATIRESLRLNEPTAQTDPLTPLNEGWDIIDAVSLLY
ncbi:uncharacterized protein F4812DRAFT_123439 [Daldinia caldariorum]|uniref:uncharacterized protein n=1 Tax=Daldinia caldariorum TaxID=326644 RepID=UPI0020076697|nr:uncharacterized protein F4812DRAFT_123439 [Daldinia caldariorum]KAI1465441.1 hypothetical protein F4812DRAFT_123439 [Daldinia caldariorum]